MKTITDEKMIEKLQWDEECRDSRIKEQKENKDYSYCDDGRPEKCSDCGSYINSHDHCPRCDY